MDAEEAAAATTDAAEGVSGACAGGLSFSADTQVATPGGERPIASLKVADHVLAYDPTTGQMTTQTIVRVFLNHDHDRLDVTLALPSSQNQTAPAATTRHATTDAETARERARAVAGHGLRAPPDAPAATTAPAVSATSATSATRVVASAPSAAATEVIHTTANHPWLTADHGWLVAGDLHLGEPVRLLDGGTARVVALRTLPGVGPMWDLSLDDVYTFAVGDIQAVVHNCPPIDGGSADSLSNLTQSLDSNRPVTVIGRDMQGRVNPVADQLRGQGFTVNTWNPRVEATVDNNREWLRYWAGPGGKGSQIVDIGGDDGRAFSEFYAMEVRMAAKWGADVFHLDWP